MSTPSDVLTRELSRWLAATDITWLELHGPGVRLRLHNDGHGVESIPVDAVFDAVPDAAPAELLTVKAPSLGHFLHSHPLHTAPLVAAGQNVDAGQVVGLLRIGALLLPVKAPQPGRFAGHIAEHGAAVAYGAPLVRLASIRSIGSPSSPSSPSST